jgi:hypothetical protein
VTRAEREWLERLYAGEDPGPLGDAGGQQRWAGPMSVLLLLLVLLFGTRVEERIERVVEVSEEVVRG